MMVAIGGWGDSEGFAKAASTTERRRLFAQNVKAMVDQTGADGTFIKLKPGHRMANIDQVLTLTGNILGEHFLQISGL